MKEEKTTEVSLDVGCGLHKQGDIGLDFGRELLPDVVGDAHHLPFRDDAFSKVICSHVLEHSLQYRRILMEARRVLQDDKVLVVVFPNFRSWQTLKCWLKNEVNEPLFHYRSERDHHRVIFTSSTMKKELRDAGFEPVRTSGEFRHFERFFNLFLAAISENVTIYAKKGKTSDV